MDSVRLKNIIILVLVLANGFLLASLGLRGAEERAATARTLAELEELYGRSGITLQTDAVTTGQPPYGRTLTRDTEAEQRLARFFLGEEAQARQQGGSIYVYESAAGSAVFRSGGSFEISGLAEDTEPEALFRRFCTTFGYEATQSILLDGGGTLTAQRYYEGLLVQNCTVAFSVEGGMLRAVQGSQIPEAYSAEDLQDAMGYATALTTFLEYCLRSGTVVSTVSAVTPCYRLQSTAAVPLALQPAWHIRTATASYYVHAYTGEVLHS